MLPTVLSLKYCDKFGQMKDYLEHLLLSANLFSRLRYTQSTNSIIKKLKIPKHVAIPTTSPLLSFETKRSFRGWLLTKGRSNLTFPCKYCIFIWHLNTPNISPCPIPNFSNSSNLLCTKADRLAKILNFFSPSSHSQSHFVEWPFKMKHLIYFFIW